MIQRSRKPAAAVLLATLVAGSIYVATTTTASHPSTTSPALAQLEVAIADPDASPETWLNYAQQLQQAGRRAHAIAAYQRVLEADPFCRTANLQCASALAQAGAADPFYGFMSKLLLLDPRMTQDIFGRPESQRYLTEDRFQSLLSQARVQSMD